MESKKPGIRVIQARLSDKKKIGGIMSGMNVDPYGVKIMVPKAVSCLVKLGPISNIRANILKQEMLSLGGDAAIARGALTGQVKETACLLMGELAVYGRLIEKLKFQPFGLSEIAKDISEAVVNYQKQYFTLKLGRYTLELGPGRAAVMGILNLTPDSFSGDGIYSSSIGKKTLVELAVEIAAGMVNDGAEIIDIGGVSSRPGAGRVPVKEELRRVIPSLKKIAKTVKAPISIDTCDPQVARAALDSGAVIVNDICGLRDKKLAKVVSDYKASVVVMHMPGNPRTMQKDPRYGCVVEDVIKFLSDAVRRVVDEGVDIGKVIVDPGIGFGKTLAHNLEILNSLDEFRVLGRPIMCGVSRKSFIGKILGVDVDRRLYGSISAAVAAVSRGAHIIRAHDAAATKQAVLVASKINNS